MSNSNYSLAHTKWMCKYHIVFTPKYRRKIIYNQLKADIREILRSVCKYKGVEILEGKLMPDHIHMIIRLDGKAQQNKQVSSIVRSIKTLTTKEVGKSIFQRSYYDHVIRNQQDYNEIWEYIENNPMKWIKKTQGLD